MRIGLPIFSLSAPPQGRAQGKNPDDLYRLLDEKAAFDLPLDSFTVDEVLTTLPGPKAQPFPKAWEGKKDRIRATALRWLERKIEADLEAGNFKREEGPLTQAIRLILALPLEDAEYPVLTHAIYLSAALGDPLATSQLVLLLRHPWGGVVEGAAQALAKRIGDAKAISGIEGLWRQVLHEQVDEFDTEKIFGVHHSQSLRPWGEALAGVLGSSEATIRVLDEIDEVPLAIERIQDFPLTGRGISCLILDRRFEVKHMDFDGRLRVNLFDDALSDHGTAVASVLGGRMGGVAPGVTIEGLDVETNLIEAVENWADRLEKETVLAKSGAPHSRILCLSGSPDLLQLKPQDLLGYQKAEARWHAAIEAGYRAGIIPLLSAGNFSVNEGKPDKKGGQLASFSRSPYLLRIGAAVRTDPTGNHWRTANYSGRGGSEFRPSFCAPTNRLAAWFGTYDVMNGTSCAAPFAAGVVALMLEANPQLSSAEVFEILQSTCKPLDGEGPEQTGWGLIDPAAAIEKAFAKKDPALAEKFRKFLN